MANIKIDKIENNDTYGKYEIYPLEKGYGYTYATPIRRILLSSVEGTAITKVKVKGADHEFSTLKGIKEDVLRVILNLQKVVFILEGSKSEKIILKVKGVKEVKASDLKTPSNVKVVNPELVLAELTDKNADLEIEAVVEKGYGFEMADDEVRNAEPGVIPLNKNFSPIIKVNFNVEATRVAQRTDYEKIVIEIWTNGAVTPEEALKESIKKLLEGAQELNDVISAEE